MKPALSFTLTSTVRFAGGQFSYDSELQHARITEWHSKRVVGGGKVKYKVSPLPPVVICLFVEILRQPTYPETCEFRSAYVRLHNDQDHFAFDRLTSVGKPIIPAAYGTTTSACTEIHEIVRAYNGKFHKLAEFKSLSIPSWMGRAGYITHDIRFAYDTLEARGESTAVTIRLMDDVKVYRFPVGEYCGALPLPGAFDESLEAKGAILISRLGVNVHLRKSKEVWDAVRSLNVIIRNDKKQIVLLQGEPGSGKEIFGRAIHYGSVRAKETEPEQLAVTGLSLPALRETLFGSMGEKGGVVDGLIARAKGGTLFLDEFDKASTKTDRADFGSTLLRVLESNKYFPERSLTERDVEDVNWILAGVFDNLGGSPASHYADDSASTKMPRDIWSRCTDRLSLKNPVKETGYAGAMFIYWHFVETARWLQNDSSVLHTLDADSTLPRVMARWLLWGAQTAGEDDAGASSDPIRPGRRILKLARQFEKRLLERGKKVLLNRPVPGLGGISREDAPRSEALAKWGVRTIRQASTAVSRELRALVVGMLGGAAGDIEKALDDPETTKNLMKRVDDVLDLLSFGE